MGPYSSVGPVRSSDYIQKSAPRCNESHSLEELSMSEQHLDEADPYGWHGPAQGGLLIHASSCTSRSVGSLNKTLPPTSFILQLSHSCHRSTTRSNFSSCLWTCVIVSSWSTLGTIKPNLLGVNLLIRHRFILSENESFP
ncbi:hypothetical protein ILYODFUR_034866 [Ilyodon furcidens]|uniref:Uncharacterized protein n=1 Tax=Ilyodon furcidens TaxID=33524 RepID=A0ABV0U1D5_9TELE